MTKWLLILITVVAGSCGDILCAKGMSQGGEHLDEIRPSGLLHTIRYIFTHRLVLLGALCDAIAFFSLLGLLSVAQLSYAVPATALGFVVDAIAARFLLGEHVHWKRWLGVTFVAAGVILTVQSGQKSRIAGSETQIVTMQTNSQ
ncbi:MAG: EamA family transporter [Candidatus Sulfotelmatobacter sp.]